VNLEDDLRAALRREPAPAEFAAGVLARTILQKPRVLPFWRRPVTLGMAAALSLAAVVPPAVYEYRQQRRALEARNQLILALSITRTQLQQIREKIRQNTRHKI
jgi:negative regulator of sigma E activity